MSTDFELVSEARKLADELGCEVTGLLLGDNVEALPRNWAATVPTRFWSATAPC